MRRYLVVDDNAAFADNLAEILRDTGAEAVTANGGPRALQLAGEQRFDALITDMRMPSMNGAALVHEVLQLDPGLPAIVVTAYTGEDDLAAARYEGLLAVLPKPVPIGQLLGLLAVARRDGLVALIDDNVSFSELLAETLGWHGFSAVLVHTVVEIDRLGSVRPFAALVDLRMPGSPDGEAPRVLQRRFPQLPVFRMSAHPEADRTGQVFAKPLDIPLVVSVLVSTYESRK
jgi:CheY-like chemotaxis protein